ncbi:hypothetical protein AKJ16_DCAP00348 [Drosera capensis]
MSGRVFKKPSMVSAPVFSVDGPSEILALQPSDASAPPTWCCSRYDLDQSRLALHAETIPVICTRSTERNMERRKDTGTIYARETRYKFLFDIA